MFEIKISFLKKQTIMKQIKKFWIVGVAMLIVNASFGQMEQTKMVGGAAMYPTKNIVENAMNSKDHTTLVAAVKAAGLVETLQGPGLSQFLLPRIWHLICCLPGRLKIY